MQRKKVITHLTIVDGEAVKVTVEAYCKKCVFWKQDNRCSFHDMGDCCRFPRARRKHENDWCGEFVPEKKGD